MKKAYPDIRLSHPKISKFVLFLVRLFGRLYLLVFLGVARVVLRGKKYMYETFSRALSNESRCILAFRHPYGGEPQLLFWFTVFLLEKMARKDKVRFSRRPHLLFIYGYELLRWGGPIARWIMPNLGAMPIHHSKLDSKGMAYIYDALKNGPYPLAIAPEGQVSYTSETVPRLEQGTVRLGFQTADYLQKRGKHEPIEILPVSVHFRYGKVAKANLKSLLRKIEKYTGTGGGRDSIESPEFIRRVTLARDTILELNEKRYNLPIDRDLPFEKRMDRVIEAALDTAE
ncbi:1-acyl-sn-glycerol-3-phosphate acyltransferase, partial [Treponema sp. OttesenSCG-928-L16]|nr:1-acyl-sn-glycerol-3-phosphate acyltransferase [Treponema sp. OttesenSCG-928-L16]